MASAGSEGVAHLQGPVEGDVDVGHGAWGMYDAGGLGVGVGVGEAAIRYGHRPRMQKKIKMQKCKMLSSTLKFDQSDFDFDTEFELRFE